MKVLVTGGTGVVGTATVRELVRRRHQVRLLSRHARKDVAQFAEEVEPYEASVADSQSVRGAAEGCDAILHVAGVVRAAPPDVTLEGVNVDGTRHMLAEADRARVRRFVYVSSLGAERGASEYHRTKRRAEELVERWRGAWTIVRPANVYGPGDGELSLLLTMVRTLPALPVIDDGDHPFQPIWMDDLAAALATVLERPDLARRTLDVAGPEVTTTNDVVDRFQHLTGKERIRIPVPNWLASTGSRIASAFGVDAPIGADQVTMLIEENVIQPNGVNALTEILHVRPTPLADGLAKLADAQPEKLPSEGVGRLFRRRYWADIVGSRYTPDELFALLRRHFATLTPDTMDVGAEPGTPTSIEQGATITMALPLRGNVQVRAEEITDRTMTLVTLEGHPLAGAIRFLFEERGDAVRFEVQSYDRAGSTIDRVAMSTIGRFLKSGTWGALVERMVEVSGGRAPEGVQRESEALDEEQAAKVEEWVEEIVVERKKEEG